MKKTAPLAVIGTAAAAAMMLTACSEVLQSSDVEDDIAEQLVNEGFEEDEFTVDCDGDIDAEVGESMDCTVEWDDGMTEEGTATIVDRTDDEVEYEIEIHTVDGESLE